MADDNEIKTPEQIQASMKAMDEYMQKIKELAEMEGLLGDSMLGRLESQTIKLHEILDQRQEVREKTIESEIAESQRSLRAFEEMKEGGTNAALPREELDLLIQSNQKAVELFTNIKQLNSEQAANMANMVEQNFQTISGSQGQIDTPKTPEGAFAAGNPELINMADSPAFQEQQLQQAGLMAPLAGLGPLLVRLFGRIRGIFTGGGGAGGVGGGIFGGGLVTALGKLGEALGFVGEAGMEALKQLSSAFVQLLVPVMEGLFSLFGTVMKEVGLFVLELDETRRKMIPYIGTVEKTNEVHKGLALEAARTRIPLSELHAEVDDASESFAMLNLEHEGSIVNLATLIAQSKQLAQEGVGKIIESMVTDEGIESIEIATAAFKGLTMQMRDLGVLPKEFSKDFQALIPTLALFGSSASTEIAKVSLLGRKARVDAQGIVDIADKFTEYGTAGQTIQEINAIFGQPIFRDPAALVRARFEQGPAGLVNELVRGIQGRVDVDELQETTAGRAQLFALSRTLNKTVQETVRILRRGVLTDQEIERIEAKQLEGRDAEFDELSKSTVTLQQQFKTGIQDLTLTAFEGAGLDFPMVSDLADELMRLGVEVARDPVSEQAKVMRESINELLLEIGLPTSPEGMLEAIKAARSDEATISAMRSGFKGIGTQMGMEFMNTLGAAKPIADALGLTDVVVSQVMQKSGFPEDEPYIDTINYEETEMLLEQALAGKFGSSYDPLTNKIMIPAGGENFAFPVETAFQEIEDAGNISVFDSNTLENFIEMVKETKESGETLPPEVTLRLADNLAVKAFVEKTAVDKINKGTDPSRKQLPQNDATRRESIGSRIGYPGM